MKDLTGQKFGMLTALRPTDKRSNGCVVWECSCSCGNVCYVATNSLTSGKTKSCGCSQNALRLRYRDISGQRFGKLVAVRPTDIRSRSNIVWECKCDCGNICYVSSSNLTSGGVQSCGCYAVLDLTGERFGLLTAIKATNRRYEGCIVWECKCDCGNTCYVSSNRLESGTTKSCGCLLKRMPEYINAEDITGKKIGMLTAIKPIKSTNNSGYILWECKCDCGNTCHVPIINLINGSTKSCGCKELVNRPTGELRLEGKRFGRLIALKPTGKRDGRSIVWECKCDCGNTCYVRASNLNSGRTRSCGCLAKETASEFNKVDISGKRFGKLVTIKPTNERKYGSIVWECKCDCGETFYAPATRLIQGKIISCGSPTCRRTDKCYKDLSGMRFGKLTAVKPTDKRRNRSVVWECKCDCGNTCYLPSRYLTTWHAKSCGCCNIKK